MYNFKANVFNTKLGPEFGTTVNTTVIANNQEDAYKEAEKSFNKYVYRLNLNHNADTKGKLRKTINEFAYNNLELCL